MNTKSPKVVELANTSIQKKKVPLSQLINKLNHFNFQGEPVLVTLKHKSYGNDLTLQAQPQPCFDEILECRWLEHDGDDQRFNNYDLVKVILTDGRRSVQIAPKIVNIDSKQVTCRLPEESHETTARATRS